MFPGIVLFCLLYCKDDHLFLGLSFCDKGIKSNTLSRVALSGCEHIGISKYEFVVKTQFFLLWPFPLGHVNKSSWIQGLPHYLGLQLHS